MLRDFLTDFLVPFLAGAICGFAVLSYGEEPCYDILFLQHPRVRAQKLLPVLPEKFCGGNLDWTSGTSLRNLKLLLNSGRVSSWRTHLLNGPGLRNNRLGSYEPHHGYNARSFNSLWERGGGRLKSHLAKRARAYCSLFQPYPDVELNLSPTLEHNLTSKAFKRQAAVIKKNCPRAVVVDNPVAGVASTKGFKIERHGAKVRGLKAPCNVSLDGESLFEVNIKKWRESNPSCTHLIWDYPMNCNRTGDSFPADPRRRTHCLTASLLRDVNKGLRQ